MLQLRVGRRDRCDPGPRYLEWLADFGHDDAIRLQSRSDERVPASEGHHEVGLRRCPSQRQDGIGVGVIYMVVGQQYGGGVRGLVRRERRREGARQAPTLPVRVGEVRVYIEDAGGTFDRYANLPKTSEGERPLCHLQRVDPANQADPGHLLVRISPTQTNRL